MYGQASKGAVLWYETCKLHSFPPPSPPAPLHTVVQLGPWPLIGCSAPTLGLPHVSILVCDSLGTVQWAGISMGQRSTSEVPQLMFAPGLSYSHTGGYCTRTIFQGSLLV